MKGVLNNSQSTGALLAVMTLGAALLAGCQASGPKVSADRTQQGAAGPTALGQLDRERARAALVNGDDLGKGWVAQVADVNDTQNPIARCVRSPGGFSGLKASDVRALEQSPTFFYSPAQGNFGSTSVPVVPSSTLVPPPATTSTLPPGSVPSTTTTSSTTSPASGSTPAGRALPASATGWGEVASYAVVLASVDTAKTVFPAITIPPLRDCLVSTAEAGLAANIAPDATATSVTVEPLSVGQTGDESTTIRAVLVVASGGTTEPVNLDLIGIRVGRLAAGVCIISTGDPPQPSDEYDLALRLGRQMAPFGA